MSNKSDIYNNDNNDNNDNNNESMIGNKGFRTSYFKKYINFSDNNLAGLFIGKNGSNIKMLKRNHPNVSVSVKENFKTKDKYIFIISESSIALDDCVLDIDRLITKIEKINKYHNNQTNKNNHNNQNYNHNNLNNKDKNDINNKNLNNKNIKNNNNNERNIKNMFDGLEIDSSDSSDSETE